MATVPAESSARRWAERVRLVRATSALFLLSTLSALLFGAAAIATERALVIGVGFGGSTVTIAGAAFGQWAAAGGRGRLTSVALFTSLLGFGVASASFAAEYGGLAGTSIGVLLSSWTCTLWIAPRRAPLLIAGIVGQTTLFVLAVARMGPPTTLAAAEGALLVAGLLIVVLGARDLTRRGRDNGRIWSQLGDAQAELHRRRARLARRSARLEETARNQLDEALAHAQTTDQLDRLLAGRVAGRSRALVRQVDRRTPLRSDPLTDGVVCGPARVLGRMIPSPYERCFLAVDTANAKRRLLITMIHLSGAHACVETLNAALASMGANHSPMTPIGRAIAWGDDELAVISEARAGRLLINALARPDLSCRAAILLAHAIAECLAKTHARGCFHLGLDPYRVVLGSSSTGIAILGVGVIQSWHAAGGDPMGASQLDATPAYRSPDAAPSPASDVYSLGVILFEMIGKLHPFVARVAESGRNASAALVRIQPGVDPSVADLVQSMLARAPSERPTMAHAAQVLRLARGAATAADLLSLCSRLGGTQQRGSAEREVR